MRAFFSDRAIHSEPKGVVHPSRTFGKNALLFCLLIAGVLSAQVWVWAATIEIVTVTVTPSSVTLASGSSQQFTAMVQGTPNTQVRWSASAGKISDSGVFTAPGVVSPKAVTITAISAADPTKTASAMVAVVSMSSPTIGTSSVPGTMVGEVYNSSISATGGTQPYKWSIKSGSLPSGIQLNSKTGMLSGSTQSTGQFTFTAQVTDKGGHSDARILSMNVVTPGSSDTSPPQSNFDGPAELPRVYVSSGVSDTPSPGKIWTVKAGQSLQQAVNNAACGDMIELQAGASFSEADTFPAKNCDDAHWITIRTNAPDSALPAEGTRITPCYAGVASLPARPSYSCANPQNVMAKIVFSKNTGDGPFVFAPGANHYRFIGLEITRNVNTPIVYALIAPTPGFAADHLVFDRMWVHGTTHDDTAKGVRFGGSTYVAVVDSYFTDFHCTSSNGACTDSSAIGGGIGDNPMGPYKIVDNFLEASGENILFGGAEATMTPADIEIRSNHIFKPLTWMKGQPGFVGGHSGDPFIVKNLFELKNAQRVLFEGNVLEHSWGGFTQTGYGLLLTPVNQLSHGVHVCPACQVTDITIRYSTISHVASGMQIANNAYDGPGAFDGERYSIHDIVIDDIDPNLYNGFGLVAQVSMGMTGSPLLQNVDIEHITAFAPNVLLNIGSKSTTKMANFTFINNMVLAGLRGLTSTGGKTYNCADKMRTPTALLNNCFTSYQFTKNGLIAASDLTPPSAWPNGNDFPQTPRGQFVNYNGGNGGDYHLVANSPYKNAGTDGKDLGADIDLVNQYTAQSK